MVGFAIDAKGNGEILGLDLTQYWKVPVSVDGIPAYFFPKLQIIRWHILKQYNAENFLTGVLSLFTPTILDAIHSAQRILGKFAIGEPSYLYAVFAEPKEPCILLPYDLTIEDMRRRRVLCFTRLDSSNKVLENYGPMES